MGSALGVVLSLNVSSLFLKVGLYNFSLIDTQDSFENVTDNAKTKRAQSAPLTFIVQLLSTLRLILHLEL